MDISLSFLSALLIFVCLLFPAEFAVDMWIMENTFSGQTIPQTHNAAHEYTPLCTQALHRLPRRNASFTDGVRKIWCFHSDTLMKLLPPPPPLPSLLSALYSCHHSVFPVSLFITHSFLAFYHIDRHSCHFTQPPPQPAPLQFPNVSYFNRPTLCHTNSFACELSSSL